MKKTEQIDKYYCDYCGAECEHTPQYVFPELEQLYVCAGRDEVKLAPYDLFVDKPKDICPKCKSKISFLLGLVDKVELDGNRTSITFK